MTTMDASVSYPDGCAESYSTLYKIVDGILLLSPSVNHFGLRNGGTRKDGASGCRDKQYAV